MDIKTVLRGKLDAMIDSLAGDLRKAFIEELLAGPQGARAAAPTPPPAPAAPVDGRGRQSKIRICIALGCTNQSKGPRFKYLCEEHKDAKEKQIKNWRKSRAEMGMDE